mmetsp:Transcript_6894/g.16030  ORF Transcript_6894/g.16030 Transcript_6894/m.16030 type:complete len:86 (+) Transcript_6894:561-818(+)
MMVLWSSSRNYSTDVLFKKEWTASFLTWLNAASVLLEQTGLCVRTHVTLPAKMVVNVSSGDRDNVAVVLTISMATNARMNAARAA